MIKARKAKFVATGIKAKVSEWDDEKHRLKKNYTNSARMNAFLWQKVADAEAKVAEHERTKKSVSARKLKEVITKTKSPGASAYVFVQCLWWRFTYQRYHAVAVEKL